MLKLGIYTTICCVAAFVFYALFFAYNPENGKNIRFKRFVRKLRTDCRINSPRHVRVISDGEGHIDDFGSDEPESED